MLHYHGTPITPRSELLTLVGRNFCVSYARPEDVKIVHEIGQSVMLDNGAFSVWRQGLEPDWPGWADWVQRWLEYPTTWAVLPDVIDGSEEENDALLAEYAWLTDASAPVWHLHESIGRLVRLCSTYGRVCFGSSGQYAVIGTEAWHRRVAEGFDAITDQDGRVRVWIHMLRGMSLSGGPYPFASADSTDVARNHNRPQNTALKLAARWDGVQCPPRWERAEQLAMGLGRLTARATTTKGETHDVDREPERARRPDGRGEGGARTGDRRRGNRPLPLSQGPGGQPDHYGDRHDEHDRLGQPARGQLTLQPLAAGTPGTMRVRPPKAVEMRGPEVDSVLACLVEDGAQFARAYRMGPCRIIVAREPQGIGGELLWHLSISCDGFERYPTWDEIKTARYALMPDNIVVGMLLPPSDDWIDLSDTFHLWEVYDAREQWRFEHRLAVHPIVGVGAGSRPALPVAPDGPDAAELGR